MPPRARDRSGKKPYIPPNATEEEKRLWSKKPIAKEQDLHPMHAIYGKGCIPAIRPRLERGDLRAIGFHSEIRLRVVEPDEVDRFDPDHLSFFNMNTPDDFQDARNVGTDGA